MCVHMITCKLIPNRGETIAATLYTFTVLYSPPLNRSVCYSIFELYLNKKSPKHIILLLSRVLSALLQFGIQSCDFVSQCFHVFLQQKRYSEIETFTQIRIIHHMQSEYVGLPHAEWTLSRSCSK